MRTRNKGRELDGILLLDKPIGMTSNAALTEVKKLFSPKKAGHTGSLDPLASGMLPICFGQATKFSQFLLEADKEYEVAAKLGVKTTTGDAEGEILATKSVRFTMSDLEEVLEQFRGEISQIPSMYSALKFQGKPLYTYARKGIEIERQARTVVIKSLILCELNQEILSIRVKCSKGTYIRTLIEDIGEVLGCGAHVIVLKRTYVAPYENMPMHTLETLKTLKQEDDKCLDTLLLPIDTALSTWPVLALTESTAFYVKQGQPVLVPQSPSSGWVKLTDPQRTFLGIGEILLDGRVAPRRLIAY